MLSVRCILRSIYMSWVAWLFPEKFHWLYKNLCVIIIEVRNHPLVPRSPACPVWLLITYLYNQLFVLNLHSSIVEKVPGLLGGHYYQFQVIAANMVGIGRPSGPSEAFLCESWTMPEPGERLTLTFSFEKFWDFDLETRLNTIETIQETIYISAVAGYHLCGAFYAHVGFLQVEVHKTC